jgi:hypothetical protein
MNIGTIIWSKDRPAQLDLLLRSQLKYTDIIETIIIYRATSDLFAAGYGELFKRHYLFDAVPEKYFKDDVLTSLNQMYSHTVLGNSDDNVFINPVDSRAEEWGLSTVAFSLRLNPRVNFCQPAGLSIVPPKLETVSPGVYSWKWAEADPRGCWGYPHPCDSNLYSRQYLFSLLQNGVFHNPCTMENWMNAHREVAPLLMQCFEKSCLVSVSNNRIQDCSTNPSGDISDPVMLTTRYLDGEQIKLEPFENLDVTQCHIVQPYEWEMRQ